MADLADRCRNSAHLSVLLGRDVVYVIEERAPGRPLLITDVGVRLPAHATASGRAMLAALPQQQVRALYPDKDAFGAGDDQAPASLSALRRVLVEVRRDGWAGEDGEVTPGLASRAMPVLDGNGYPVAAVAVTFPLEERTPQLLDEITAEIGATVRTLSRRLGGVSLRCPAGALPRSEGSAPARVPAEQVPGELEEVLAQLLVVVLLELRSRADDQHRATDHRARHGGPDVWRRGRRGVP